MEEQLPSTSKIQESGTAISINRRMKRKSSDDCLEMQKKVFVNEKKANSSDDKKMKEIFGKDEYEFWNVLVKIVFQKKL